MHETIHHDAEEPKATERSFGLLFAFVFAAVAAWPLIDMREPRWWALAIAALFLGLALAAPGLLAPLNRLWMAFGKVLHRIVSPVVLGFLYLIAVVPTGWYLRLRGMDPLRLKLDPAAKTYWQHRDPAGPVSFKNQF
jgi:hypothetical protein